MRARDGATVRVVEIHAALTVDLEYEVLRPWFNLAPHIRLTTERGDNSFTYEVKQSWDAHSCKAGRHTSRALVSGNLPTKGTDFVGSMVLRR